MRNYIRKRVSGEVKSDLGGKSDVLTLMLESNEVFKEDDIIDEVIDLLVAGTQTTQLTTQFALSHFMTDAESLARARAEFDALVA